MSNNKQFRIPSLQIALAGFVLLFLTVNLTQTGCAGGGSGSKNSANDTGVKAVAATGSSTPKLSGNVPSEVSFANLDTSNIHNRITFDEFSWQTFIALCWPVSPQRGVPLNPNDPNTFLNMTNTSPVVWTSYKDQWDLFGQRNRTPTPWDSWIDSVNICSGDTKHVFGTAKSKMLPGEGQESLSVPLIDQRKNYVLFEIRYNEVQYNFIVNNGLYLSKNLYSYQQTHGGAVTMPASTATMQGSILVKAAWKVLTDSDDASRYYMIDDSVYDPVSKICKKMRLGLVGLHIAQKVDSFPEWVWSSFEQVDNVPGAPNAKAPYSFNNNSNIPSITNHGFANKPNDPNLIPDPANRTPVQVVRLNEIPTTPAGMSTVDINKIYQATVGNTWMRYYQLVITQWPSNPGQFKQRTMNGIYPNDCGGAFPVNNCVNTTMETYFQNQNDASGAGGNSCMSCHYTAPNTDFSWSLQLRSH